MKSIFRIIPIVMMMLGSLVGRADAPVKAEMRSAWVATVWQLDWPPKTISETGNSTQLYSQKQAMRDLLDSLQVNNFNSMCFQVRSRCDAMYKSSYEPWSSDLVSKRGLDPGYDPLEFVVEECHKRGMECFAWINPYRYESVTEQWGKDPNQKGCYRATNPDWVMDVKGASILNPGKPEVTQRICDIISEIVTNYDIDGVLFDDYFYLSGTPASADADLYEPYKAAGGTLSLSDWRIENVNKMVHAVYTTVKSLKPWVRFGISPAGIACTDPAVAKKYGVSACPTGSDWQLRDINSCPVAWLYNGDLDFISPQIYWTIGNGTNYDPATWWWSYVGAHFNRHMYVSHSISSLTPYSKVRGSEVSSAEAGHPRLYASGPNNTSYEEYANEIRLNREYTLNDAPGSVFYSCKYIYKQSPKFGHYLRNTVFNTRALIPPMTWLPANRLDAVKNLKLDGGKLSWDAVDNVRYTVYAVPSNVDLDAFEGQPEYLLDVVYNNVYDLPEGKIDGFNYVVCIYDRFGNEYAPVSPSRATGKLAAPKLGYPAHAAKVEYPFSFKWEESAGATSYILEVSDTPDMQNLIYAVNVDETSHSSGFDNLPLADELYWRVRAVKNFHTDGVSEVRSFKPGKLSIVSPVSASENVTLTPMISWSVEDRPVDVQISESPDFSELSIVYEAHSETGSIAVPRYVLKGLTTYYVRLCYTLEDYPCTTPSVSFTTQSVEAVVPVVVVPKAGGVLHANEAVTIAPVDGANFFRVEICASSSFSSRSSYVSSNLTGPTFMDNKVGEEIKISSSTLKDGNTYYVRVRGNFNSESGAVNTDFCEPVEFTYSTEYVSVDDILADGDSMLQIAMDARSGNLVVTAPSGANLKVDVVNISGGSTCVGFHGVSAGVNEIELGGKLAEGVYIATASTGNAAKSVKIIVKAH